MNLLAGKSYWGRRIITVTHDYFRGHVCVVEYEDARGRHYVPCDEFEQWVRAHG